MTDVLKKLTAAPRAFTFKGERYELSPLSLRDLAQLKDFVKRNILQEAKKDATLMAEVGAPPEHITELWREASEACKKPLESSFMQDIEPAVEFMFLTLRHAHPSITTEIVTNMLEDPAVQTELTTATQELNEVEADVKNV